MKSRTTTMSVDDLVIRARQGEDPDELIRIGTAIDKISDADFEAEGFLVRRLAVLTGYSSNFICEATKATLLREKICLRVLETEFGLFEQSVYARDPTLASFAPHLVYLCVGHDHLEKSDTAAEAERWLALWQATHEFLSVDIIANTFETPAHRPFGNLEAKDKGRVSMTRALNAILAERAPHFVHFSDIEWLSGYWGKHAWRDDRLYDSAKIPVAFENIGRYATNLASVCSAIFGRSRKCLALDLDNTLWGGVIGDDGIENIRIGPDGGVGEAFLRFQKHIKELAARGIVLTLCSKNDPDIARQALDTHPDMLLRFEDFACCRINWNDKASNLLEIAQELNIGVDSIVFVDDNPAERALVRQFLPDVAVIEMPDDPADYVAALTRANPFDAVAVTAEDLGRNEFYKANARRSSGLNADQSYDDYLASLSMTAKVLPITAETLPRATQLINKTNQFNVTTPRYTQAEVSAFATRGDVITLTVRLLDKYGDNGLISVFIATVSEIELSIDTWLMSCRVLKRNVEWLVLREVVKLAQARGLKRIIGTYRPTKKNGLVRELFRELGFSPVDIAEEAQRWSLSLNEDQAILDLLNKNLGIEIIQ